MSESSKKCAGPCGQVKLKSHFKKNGNSADGYERVCLDCKAFKNSGRMCQNPRILPSQQIRSSPMPLISAVDARPRQYAGLPPLSLPTPPPPSAPLDIVPIPERESSSLPSVGLPSLPTFGLSNLRVVNNTLTPLGNGQYELKVLLSLS